MKAPAALMGVIAFALLPSVVAKPYPVEEARQLQNATELERRQKNCGQGFKTCGWYGNLCCPSSQECGTNAQNEAICVAGGAAAGAASNGQWTYVTSIYTATDLVTRTSVYSSYLGGAPGSTPQPTANCAASQSSCGSTCCDGGYYCSAPGVCKPAAGSTPGASATGSPTTTMPFSTPIPTGAAAAPVEQGSGGLSGGAIAGIVIGVIAGIILLLLICFYCCAKAAFDSVLAIFGLGGKKRRRHEESTYIEEHHRHGSAAGGGRWYGQGSSRPSRPPKEKKGGMGNLLGVGAGLAGLAAVLGMKRKHDQRHDEKSNISSSYYSYSDYTSTSSASSDRRTRNTRHSSRH